MFSESILALVSAAAALLAAGAGLWAARAAHRSSVTAHEAAEHAQRIDRRGVLRDLIGTCHRLIAESIELGSLIEELKTEYRVLATFSGQSGGSREKLLIQRAESKQKEILALQDEAQQQIQERAHLLDAAEENFTQALGKFDGYLVQVLRIKDSLEREIAAVAGDNRIYREGRIKGLNPRLQKS